jgi:hypothetical protein
VSHPQHMISLEKANKVRFARADLKREIEDGQISLADALEDGRAGSMTVFSLLCSQHRWACFRARKALTAAGDLLGSAVPLPELKPVGSLTGRQKRALLQACGEAPKGSDCLPACEQHGLAITHAKGCIHA